MKSLIHFLYIFSALFLFFFSSEIALIFAQSVKSNCVITKIGNPGAATPILPPPCSIEGGTGGGWPFPKKSPSQYQRVDQGWDLQYNQQANISAIAPGTLTKGGNDPGYFGVDYPVLKIDSPICGFSEVYYGHVHLNPSVLDKHVNTGEIIAHTDPGGVNSPSNWLEVGFWQNGPAARGVKPSKEGQMIKSWLLTGHC